MTKEEKIAILKDIIDGEIINPQVRSNVGIWAIKALEQSSYNSVKTELNGGMISRQAEPMWIPVSEKLPEEGKEVLTCSNGGFIEIQSIEGTYGYWENQHGDWSDVDEVIAWTPLPKPYEPQERSDKE